MLQYPPREAIKREGGWELNKPFLFWEHINLQMLWYTETSCRNQVCGALGSYKEIKNKILHTHIFHTVLLHPKLHLYCTQRPCTHKYLTLFCCIHSCGIISSSLPLLLPPECLLQPTEDVLPNFLSIPWVSKWKIQNSCLFFFYNHHFQGWVVLKRMGVHFLYPYTPVKLIFNHCSSDKENGNGIYDETHIFFSSAWMRTWNVCLKCLSCWSRSCLLGLFPLSFVFLLL